MGERYAAFLRAINTGGRRLTNDQLLEPFRALGFTDVAAYQAAGNVVFRAGDGELPVDADDTGRIERIEHALHEAYGFAAPVFVRTFDELGAAIDRSPFGPDELAATEGRVQVTFLRATPDAAAVDAVAALVPAEDRVVVDGREWFWLPRAGISASTLPVAAVEAALGPMTTRTLGTLQRMVAKFA